MVPPDRDPSLGDDADPLSSSPPLDGRVYTPLTVSPALAAELELPAGCPMQSIVIVMGPADPTWSGYTHHVFGLIVARPATWPPPWPYLLLRDPDTGGVIQAWQVWLSQVCYQTVPLIAERQWHPRRGIQDRLVSTTPLPSTIPRAAVLQAWRGFEYLDTLTPPDPDEAEALCQRIEAKYWELRPLGRHACTQLRVAAEIPITPRHLRRVWDQTGRPRWPPKM
jgi:hypothetical protein